MVARGLEARLAADKEAVLVEHLNTTYWKTVTRDDADAMLLGPRTTSPCAYKFAPHWIGVFGVFPGTGSGNEAGEALHVQWEAELDAHADTPNIQEAIRSLQALYSEDDSDTDEETPYELVHAAEDEALAGAAAAYVDPAAPHNSYHVVTMENAIVVAFSADSTKELDVEAAGRGAQMLFTSGDELRSLMRASGILYIPDARHHRDEFCSMTEYNKHFEHIAYVMISRDHPLHPSGYAGDLCTCSGYLLYAKCVHVYAAESLDLPTRPGFRDCSGKLPHRGRKKRSRVHCEE